MDPQPLSPRPRRWQSASADDSMNIVDNLLSPANHSSTYLSAPSSPLASRSDRSLSPLSPPVPGRFNVSTAGKTVMPPIRGFGRPTGPRRSLRGGRRAEASDLKRNESVMTSGTTASQEQAFNDVLTSLDTLSSSPSSSSLSSLVNPHPPRRTPSPRPRPRSTLSVSTSSNTPTRTNSFLTGPRTPNRGAPSQPQATPSRAAGLIAMFEKKAGDTPASAPLQKTFTGVQPSPVKATTALSSSLGSSEKKSSDDLPAYSTMDVFDSKTVSAVDKGKSREIEPFRSSSERSNTTSSPATSLLKSFPLPSSVSERPPLRSTQLSPIPASSSSIQTSQHEATPPPPVAKDAPPPSVFNYSLPPPAPIKPSPSPLSSVRTMVAAWRNRTAGSGSSPEDASNKSNGIRGRGRNALGEGFLSIRRRNGRFGDRHRASGPADAEPPTGDAQRSGQAVTETSPSLVPQASARAPGLAQPRPRAGPSEPQRERAVSQALSIAGEPLRTGTLFYLNVHDMATAPNFKWVRADARLFPTALSLSWMTPSGGRAVVVLDLLWCQEVRSIPSPNHPSARADIGSVAAREQYLADNLYPFQMVYDDGLERLGCESARDRVRWVGAIWDALERAPAPGRTVSMYPNRSEDSSSDGGSASTTYNNSLVADRLSRADSLLQSADRTQLQRPADDAVIATSGGLTAPIAQRGSRRLAIGGLDRQPSLRRVASEADLELATEAAPVNHRHTVHPVATEPPPLTAEVARSRPASRDFAFAGGIPPPRLQAPFTVMQRTPSPSDYHSALLPSALPATSHTPFAFNAPSIPSHPPLSPDAYETAASIGAFTTTGSAYDTASTFRTEYTARAPATSSAFATATQGTGEAFTASEHYSATERNLPEGSSAGGTRSVYETASLVLSSATLRPDSSHKSFTTALPPSRASRISDDEKLSQRRDATNDARSEGKVSSTDYETAPPASTLSRSLATARTRPTSEYVTASVRTSFYDASLSGNETSRPASSYETAPPPPISHSSASHAGSSTGPRSTPAPSWRSYPQSAELSAAEDWENGTQISDPDSDTELLDKLERQSSIGSKYPSYRTGPTSLYKTAPTASFYQSAQPPSSEGSHFTTAHTGSCTTKYLTASICTCQETASVVSSISRPTSLPSQSSVSRVAKEESVVSTAKSTKASTPSKLRRVPVPTLNSVASSVFGGGSGPEDGSQEVPSDSEDYGQPTAGGIISADVNKLLNYLEGQETSRRGQAARMSEQLNRIETNVFGISQAVSGKENAPPVPSKEVTPPSSPSASSPSTPSSASSTSTARPVTPPTPVSDAVARELDDMRSMLGTLLGRTNDILDAQAKAKKSESATRGPTLHRIEDLLRRLLVRSGDSEIADEMGYELDNQPPSPPPPSSLRGNAKTGIPLSPVASSFKGGQGSVYSDQALRKAPAPPGSYASSYDREGNITPVPSSLLDGDLPGIDFDEDYELRNLPPADPPYEQRQTPSGMPRGLHNIRRKMPPQPTPEVEQQHWSDEQPYHPAPHAPHRHSPHVPSPVPEEPQLEPVQQQRQSYYDESPDEDPYDRREDEHRGHRRHPSPPTPQPVGVPSPVGPGYGPSAGFPPPSMRPPMMGPPLGGMDVPRMNMPRIASSRDPITTTYFRRGFPPPGPGMGMGMGMFPGPMGMPGPGMGPFMPGLRPGFGGPMGPNVNPALRRPGFFPPGVPGASGDYGLPRDAGHLARVGDPSRSGMPDSGLGISGTSTSTTTTPTTTTTTPTPQLVTPSDPPGHMHSASDATHVTDDSFKRALGNSQALAEAQGEQQNEISRYLHGVSDQIEAGRKQQHDELAGILRDINDLRSQIQAPQHVQGHVQPDGTVQLDTGEIVDGVHGEPAVVPVVTMPPPSVIPAVTVAPPLSHHSSSHSSHVRGAVLPDGTVVADGKIVDGVHGTNLLPSSPVISDGQLKDIEQDIKLGQLQDRVSELMQRTTPRSSDGLPGPTAPPTIVPIAVPTAGPVATEVPVVAEEVVAADGTHAMKPLGNYTDVIRERTVQKEREVIREGPGYHHKEVDKEDIHEKDHEHDDTAGLALPPLPVLSVPPPAPSTRINPHTGRPLTTPSLLGAGAPASVVPPSAVGEPHLVKETIEEITQMGPGAPTHTKVTQEYTTDPKAPTLAPASQLGNVAPVPKSSATVPAIEHTEVVHETLRPNNVAQPGLVKTSEIVTEIDPQRPNPAVTVAPPTTSAANVPTVAKPAGSAATPVVAPGPPAAVPVVVPPPVSAPAAPASVPNVAPAAGGTVPVVAPAPGPLGPSNLGNVPAVPAEKPIFSTNHPKPATTAANVPTGPAAPTLPATTVPAPIPTTTSANVPAPSGPIASALPVPTANAPAVSPKTGKRVHYQPLMPSMPVAAMSPRPSQPPPQPPVTSMANMPNDTAAQPAVPPLPQGQPSTLGNAPVKAPPAVPTTAPHNGPSTLKTSDKPSGTISKPPPTVVAPNVPAAGPAVTPEHGGSVVSGQPQPVVVSEALPSVKSSHTGSVLRKPHSATPPPAQPIVGLPEPAVTQPIPVIADDAGSGGKTGKNVQFAPSRPASAAGSKPPSIANVSAAGAAPLPSVPANVPMLEEVILPDGTTAYIKKQAPDMMEEEAIVLPDGRKAVVPRQPRPKGKLTKPPAPPPSKLQTPPPSVAPVAPAPSAIPPPAPIPVPVATPVASAPGSIPPSVVIDKPGSASAKLSKKPSKVSMADAPEFITETVPLIPEPALGTSAQPPLPAKTSTAKPISVAPSDPDAILAEQKRLANVAKANAEKAAAEAADRERIQKAKADKAKLVADRHQANVDALTDLRKALDMQGGEEKAWRSAYNEGTKAKEKRRADKITRDKKWQEALDKLLADKEEMKKHREAADKKPGSQAILDALKTAGDQQSAFLRKMAAEIMDHNSNQHKVTQTEAQKWAREQVGFNLAGYLDDFSKALSGEVRTLLKEVGDLRESRRALQYELAELLLMKGRQAGGDLMAVMPYPSQPPKPAKAEKKEEGGKKEGKDANKPKAPVPAPMWSHWGQYPPAGLQVGGPARPLPFPGLVPGPPPAPAAPAQPAGSRPLPAV